jgi:hypothetical protein
MAIAIKALKRSKHTMARPFTISPKAVLKGAALMAEVRDTYPLSPRDEHAIRTAVESLLVTRLRGASGEVVRGFDVHKAAIALGVTPADLERTLARHGVDVTNDQRRLFSKKAGSKLKLVHPRRRGKARRTRR